MRNFQKDRLVHLTEQRTLTFESNTDPKDQEDRIDIDTYGNSGDKNELLVAISSRNGNIKHILCVENNSIILKEGELPNEILSETKEFIFYLRCCGGLKDLNLLDRKTATFESSAKRGFFLACSDDGRNLILKRPTEADKTTSFFMVKTYFVGAFTLSKNGEPCHIQNYNDRFLVAHPEKSVATLEENGEAKGERAIFYVNQPSELAFNDGAPVIFSCKIDEKNYLLCVEGMSVIIKNAPLPTEIPEETSELVFYMKMFSASFNTYRFQSSLKFGPSLEQEFCLAWENKEKLILKQYYEGEINEAMSFRRSPIVTIP
ncbi:uncharacterized protein [Eleutherodactylus coqui]